MQHPHRQQDGLVCAKSPVALTCRVGRIWQQGWIMMDYRVSVLQYCPRLFDVVDNLKRIESLFQGLETDLIVLPELAASGYVFTQASEVAAVAEKFTEGPVHAFFEKMSTRHDCSIVFGFAERCGDSFYNSAALINPDGSNALYRKVHLFDREKLFFTPGNEPFSVHTAKLGVRVGMMICYDWQFPEAARSLALQGSQIICHPSNLVLPWCQQAMLTRCLENRVFGVTANRTGYEENNGVSLRFTGQSQISGTIGDILERMDDQSEGIRTVVIDTARALDKNSTAHNNAFRDRRPEMYFHG